MKILYFSITPVSGIGSDTAREVTVSDSEDDSLVVVHEEEEEKEMEQVNIAPEVEENRICTSKKFVNNPHPFT